MNKKTHVALRIALLALILVFVVVCGAHLGGLRHDDAGGVHSIATAIVIAVAVVLVLRAAANREGVRPHQATLEHGPLFGRRAMPGRLTGVLTPLRC
jgi:membrane protein YdbS with pleckstrin-like domain